MGKVLFFILFIISSFLNSNTKTEQPKDLSLEQLFNINIMSASNRSEKLLEAPATVIVISKTDIKERGYTSLLELIQDMPGMDVVLNYGDSYLKNYWRGYRNVIGAPYLIMVDGLIFNHLYFNTASILSVMPLSNIERVEFVYGPASSVYGANAFMGVINIITKSDFRKDGTFFTSSLVAGFNKSISGDLNVFYKKKDFGVRVSMRIENDDIKEWGINDNFEWTKNTYYADRSLWGGLVDNNNIAGQFSSPIRNRGVDIRCFLGTFEIAAQYFSLNSGYGFSYPADKVIPNASWIREDYSLNLRNDFKITEKISSSSLIRYRESNVPGHSYFIEAYGDPRGIDYSYWMALSNSWSIFQKIEVIVNNKFSFLTGLKYEQKDLHKAYNVNYGPFVSPNEIDPSTYDYPKIPSSNVIERLNRKDTVDLGFFLQTKYEIKKKHHLHLGIRVDDNSVYGTAITLRAGYIGEFNGFILKCLYGEAFQEPSPRSLYGGWSGSGSDPSLKPENSKTFELSLNKISEQYSHLISFYYVKNVNTILNFAGGALNVGERNVYGLDYHFRALFYPSFIKQLKLWAYYSFIKGRGDEIYDIKTDTYKKGEIGDLATHKAWIGMTVLYNDKIYGTLKGRWIGDRKTVYTNPIKKVNSYFVFDMNLGYNLNKGIYIGLKINNLFNKMYFHPGVRGAGTGDDPGYWESGTWQGSNDWYNSLMPQPGRTIILTIGVNTESFF